MRTSSRSLSSLLLKQVNIARYNDFDTKAPRCVVRCFVGVFLPLLVIVLTSCFTQEPQIGQHPKHLSLRLYLELLDERLSAQQGALQLCVPLVEAVAAAAAAAALRRASSCRPAPRRLRLPLRVQFLHNRAEQLEAFLQIVGR